MRLDAQEIRSDKVAHLLLRLSDRPPYDVNEIWLIHHASDQWLQILLCGNALQLHRYHLLFEC